MLSEELMKKLRKIIEIDEELCNGCGQCVPDCAEGSLLIIDGKARLMADNLCDGLGACLGSCPTGALKIIERVTEEFDEKAVEKYLIEKKKAAQPEIMRPALSCRAANGPSPVSDSALSNWPVQIRLIPPGAPFLKNCDLLVAADCTAMAYPQIQQDFIKGRTVMMGCPKFDDQPLYVERFSEIFKTQDLNSLTMLIMEAPCCSAMTLIIKKAMKDSGGRIKIRQIVISSQGRIIDDSTW